MKSLIGMSFNKSSQLPQLSSTRSNLTSLKSLSSRPDLETIADCKQLTAELSKRAISPARNNSSTSSASSSSIHSWTFLSVRCYDKINEWICFKIYKFSSYFLNISWAFTSFNTIFPFHFYMLVLWTCLLLLPSNRILACMIFTSYCFRYSSSILIYNKQKSQQKDWRYKSFIVLASKWIEFFMLCTTNLFKISSSSSLLNRVENDDCNCFCFLFFVKLDRKCSTFLNIFPFRISRVWMLSIWDRVKWLWMDKWTLFITSVTLLLRTIPTRIFVSNSHLYQLSLK